MAHRSGTQGGNDIRPIDDTNDTNNDEAVSINSRSSRTSSSTSAAAIIDDAFVDDEGRVHRLELGTQNDDDNHSFKMPFDEGHRFVVRQKTFKQQFAQIYYTRLNLLRDVVLEQAKRSIGSGKDRVMVCQKIIELKKDRLSLVAGTLYKDMRLKPCILDEYTKNKGTRTATSAAIATTSAEIGARVSYVDEATDSLVLEDEYGRVKLGVSPAHIGALNVKSLVSGLVIAVLGAEEKGEFKVHQLFVPDIAPQLPPPKPADGTPARYIAIISGLCCGSPHVDPLPAQLMADYISGYTANVSEQKSVAASIARVIIAGNSLYRPPVDLKAEMMKKGTGGREKSSLGPLKELDMLVTQLAASCPVDIMPGESDPSNYTLPQQPLHPCLFPSGRTFSTFVPRTNPCHMSIHDVTVMGCAGQNIDDIAKYATAEQPIDFLESTLRWRNICPTAPDTLACYPFDASDDPFVLTVAPHIYFAANQSSYDTRLIEGEHGQVVRLVMVPSFATTRTIVLININDLSCTPITFGVHSSTTHTSPVSSSSSRAAIVTLSSPAAAVAASAAASRR